jgi:N-carbamoylputrescine amidase
MTRIVRVALTETCNACRDMPATRAELPALADRLDTIRAANVAHHVELARAAAGIGARLVGFGELFAAPYFALEREPMWLALAEDALTGPTVSTLRAAARELDLVLVAPIYELDGATGRRFNTAVVIDETGEVIGKYRKTHIPHGANEEASFCETFYYDASDGELGHWPRNVSANRFFPVFETSICRLGVAICYDRHFEGVMSALGDNGAEVVLAPTITFGAKSRRMWDLEFPVDAARHRLYIGGCNRSGSEPPWNQPYFGASYFAGPEGALPPVPAPPGLVVADLDLDALHGPDPSGWDFSRDRRPDIY